MSRILLKGNEIPVPLVAAASSFSEATVVRLANPSTTDRVITCLLYTSDAADE